jgi:hypothetical protein
MSVSCPTPTGLGTAPTNGKVFFDTPVCALVVGNASKGTAMLKTRIPTIIVANNLLFVCIIFSPCLKLLLRGYKVE